MVMKPVRRRAAIVFTSLAVACLFSLKSTAADEEPIRLHSNNPHYFQWRGKPAVLITATEHYGAVLNLDFDFIPYLEELKARGFNLTRIFSGAYREIEGSFQIKENTLAPKQGRFVCPWARSSIVGVSEGGNKFDLDSWDPAYFGRLKSFLLEANKRGIVVEYVFFCTMYDEELWQASPMNARNNVNAIGNVGRHEVYSMKERKLQDAQEKLVRKIVTELKDAPNLYFEICNEAYERGGLTREWNDRIVAVIQEAESNLPDRHLIAQGFPPEPPKIENPNPAISIFNFHVVNARCISENFGYNRVIADDETGGKGIAALPYRREAWEFICAGGAVVNHLDFSFTCSRPNGTHQLSNEPGGGGPDIRAQLAVLKKFLESFDFVQMKPDSTSVRVVSPHGATARALSEAGVSYAVYVNGRGPSEVEIKLPPGKYTLEWFDTRSGSRLKNEEILVRETTSILRSPAFEEDVALSLRRMDYRDSGKAKQ
jgi:hypothetical protein